jgi:MFS family permease
MLQPLSPSIETRQSWLIATAALACMCMAFGGAWIVAVALSDIAAEVGGSRSVPALAAALTWLCAGAGGILMSRVANAIGTRWTVMGGAVMIAVGLAISTLGPPWPLWLGHGVIGLVGIGGINAPLYVYVSRWFDRRRGSALALISSGSYLAGALWPLVFEHTISMFGWRTTMLGYGVLEAVIIIPLAALILRTPPALIDPPGAAADGHLSHRVLRLSPNVVYGLLCFAGILCCIPMAMPQGHLVAFCSDLGFSRTFGAAMLSLLLGAAFLSRQLWGALSDRIGGLATILIGSVLQAGAMAAFLATQSEVGLITVSIAFGIGFSGIIPAYVLALRELFPAREAYWRIPTLLMTTTLGMAAGGWAAGLLYDHFGYYLPAFSFGLGANLVHMTILGFLVWRATGNGRHTKLATA